MTPDKPKTPTTKPQPTPVKPAVASAPPGPTPNLPPLFRPADWLCFGITTLVMFLSYMYTLAPDLTLQDSGELAVGSMYAGVPHPPGYPVWTIYTWLFSVLVPISNIAYRVAISSAVAGALTCGLVAIMVSRGSSMLMESVEELKSIAKRWENEICVVTGFVAGALIGFDGFMWSQAVIVEVYTLTALSLAGFMVALFRWVYAPHQHRYLYLAWFIFGIAFNNHQSVLVCALSMAVVMAWVQPQLGRDALLGGFCLLVVGLLLKEMGSLALLTENAPLLRIYYCMTALTGFAWVALCVKSKGVGAAAPFLLAYIAIAALLTFFAPTPAAVKGGVLLLGALAVLGALIVGWVKKQNSFNWALLCVAAFAVGAAFYLFMAVTSMTNPPMNWGYPRTVQGFIHAFTRGQYERIHPTDGTGTGIPWMLSLCSRYVGQLKMLFDGSVEELNLVYVLIAVVPFLYFGRFQKRERAWLAGLLALWVVMGPLLMMLFNPQPDRQSLSLIKVFFTPSHMFLAMGTGYGLTLLLATLAAAYDRHRPKAVIVAVVIAAIAIYGLTITYDKTVYSIPRAAAQLGVGLAVAVTLILVVARRAAPIGLLLGFIALMPGWSILSHWSENEQRGHLFGFWFGHDMFTPPFKGADGKPLYPKMDKDTVLFGGTDPGRFCPTYMIFCESFIPPEKRRDQEFDRRDVYIITQNALADGTYLNYIRAHYFRSAQIDPPFFSELLRSQRERDQNYKTNFWAKLLLPLDHFFLDLGDRTEKRRRVGPSFFKPSDFQNAGGFAEVLKTGGKPEGVSRYIMENLSPEAREEVKTLTGKGLETVLAKQLNRLLDSEYEVNKRLPEMQAEIASLTNELAALKDAGKSDSRGYRKKQSELDALQKEVKDSQKLVPFYTPERFKDVALSDYVKQFIAQNPQLHSRIRLSRLLLEEAYPGMFKKSQGGLYPDREIYTPSDEDSRKCFADYMADAQERMKKNQLKPGEDVRVVRDPASGQDRVQVSGQVAVMAINALLTKVIFDHNPNNEFYVEESFPLDWMFPHLTPYGIIMKINRNPVRDLTPEMLSRDHEFWSQYSDRLVGNWITYDTPISNICAFAEKTYLHHDYRGFKGDPRFVRDDDAQKAFSKLRSSIGGMYAWRLAPECPPEYRPKTAADSDRLLKETEFAFKQAFAFCPYSPEALYRYVNVLLRNGRVDEARMMAATSKKLDPDNSGLDRLIEELDGIKKRQAEMQQGQSQLPAMEAEFRARPGNVSNAVQLANSLAQLGQTERVRQIADAMLTNASTDPSAVFLTVQVYSQLHDTLKLETALQNWAKVNPTPEAWLDLAAIKTVLGKTPDALAAVKTCLEINAARLAANPKASNLALLARTDERLQPLQALPEFQRLLGTNK